MLSTRFRPCGGGAPVASVRPNQGHEQMVDRPGVVAEDAPIPDAKSAALEDDNTASLERFGGLVHGLPPTRDGEVGTSCRQLFNQLAEPVLEIAPRDRRPHGGGKQRRR